MTAALSPPPEPGGYNTTPRACAYDAGLSLLARLAVGAIEHHDYEVTEKGETFCLGTVAARLGVRLTSLYAPVRALIAKGWVDATVDDLGRYTRLRVRSAAERSTEVRAAERAARRPRPAAQEGGARAIKHGFAPQRRAPLTTGTADSRGCSNAPSYMYPFEPEPRNVTFARATGGELPGTSAAEPPAATAQDPATRGMAAAPPVVDTRTVRADARRLAGPPPWDGPDPSPEDLTAWTGEAADEGLPVFRRRFAGQRLEHWQAELGRRAAAIVPPDPGPDAPCPVLTPSVPAWGLSAPKVDQKPASPRQSATEPPGPPPAAPGLDPTPGSRGIGTTTLLHRLLSTSFDRSETVELVARRLAWTFDGGDLRFLPGYRSVAREAAEGRLLLKYLIAGLPKPGRSGVRPLSDGAVWWSVVTPHRPGSVS